MTDILLDDSLDIVIDPITGDFVTGESTAQQQKILLLSDKNDFKEAPPRGVGAFGFLNDDDKGADLNREIRLEFGTDGMDVKTISTLNGIINIDAPYAADNNNTT